MLIEERLRSIFLLSQMDSSLSDTHSLLTLRVELSVSLSDAGSYCCFSTEAQDFLREPQAGG